MKAIERLYKYLDFKGVKPVRFEKTIGLSNGYLGKQLKRKGGLGEDIINTIVNNCSDLNIEWLITGGGTMLKDTQKSEEYSFSEQIKDIDVNSFNEINKRIEIIKDRMNFGYSSFAKKIGLNQSAIKNVISGRNKPSFDFINKLLTAFPYINANWLLIGKGHLLNDKVRDVGSYLLREQTSVQEPTATYKKEKKNVHEDCTELKESYKTIIDTQKLLIESLQGQIELLKNR